MTQHPEATEESNKTRQTKKIPLLLTAKKSRKNMKLFYTNLRTLKYPKPWKPDIAHGHEDQLLQQVDHETSTTPVKTNLTRLLLNQD
jgi:hypothetical protein